jgi:hypothetical protein
MLRSRRLVRHIAGVAWPNSAATLSTRASGPVRAPCRPLVPILQDLLGVCRGDNHAAPVRTHLHLRPVRFTLDRDRGAARNLAALVGEVSGGTPSQNCGATINEPGGNPRQTDTPWAAGTATGRPQGQRRTTRLRLPEQSGHTSTHMSGNGFGDRDPIPQGALEDMMSSASARKASSTVATAGRDDEPMRSTASM